MRKLHNLIGFLILSFAIFGCARTENVRNQQLLIVNSPNSISFIESENIPVEIKSAAKNLNLNAINIEQGLEGYACRIIYAGGIVEGAISIRFNSLNADAENSDNEERFIGSSIFRYVYKETLRTTEFDADKYVIEGIKKFARENNVLGRGQILKFSIPRIDGQVILVEVLSASGYGFLCFDVELGSEIQYADAILEIVESVPFGGGEGPEASGGAAQRHR